MAKCNSSLLSRHVNISEKFLSDVLSLKSLSKVGLFLGIKTRKKSVYTPGLVLLMWICCTCWKVSGRSSVAHMNVGRGKQKKQLVSPSDAAFCNAKKRLSLSFIKAVFARVLKLIEKQRVDRWQWKHGRVRVVDGTGVSVEDTKANLKKFDRQNNKGRDCGYCIGRLLGIFDLGHGGLIDLAISNWKGKASGELSLLQKLWSNFKSGDTLLGDACFCSYSVFAEAILRNVCVVTELRGKMKWRLNKKKRDQIIVIAKPYKKPDSIKMADWNRFPDIILLRVITYDCAPKGFRPKKKYVVTTHIDAKKVSANEIAELYRRRWQVELNLRSIKTHLGMDLLKAKTPQMVEKHIWVHILTYNLIRLQMAKVAKIYDRQPDELSFAVASDLLGLAIFLKSIGVLDTTVSTQLQKTMLYHRVGNRKNRYEPRVLKRRKKNFAFLSKSRELARLSLHKKRKT